VPRVYVSIGSNIERETHIRSAIRALQRRYGTLALSSVYESPPVGFDGENFYNLVVAFEADSPPEQLVADLHEIERAHGRQRSGDRFGPRTLDLDLLMYGDLIRHDDAVDLPRREILDYAFVLQPFAEIAADAVHPETHQRIGTLWNLRQQQATPLVKTGFDPR